MCYSFGGSGVQAPSMPRAAPPPVSYDSEAVSRAGSQALDMERLVALRDTTQFATNLGQASLAPKKTLLGE